MKDLTHTQKMAVKYLNAGLSIIPVVQSNCKKNKAPLEVKHPYFDIWKRNGLGLSWEYAKTNQIPVSKVPNMFPEGCGIGLVGGFGNVQLFDIDTYHYTKYVEKENIFFRDVIDKIITLESIFDKLTMQITQSDGRHLIFKYRGKTDHVDSKLAVVPKEETGTKTDKDLIDFRKKGYVVIEPSKNYQVIAGSLLSLEELSHIEFAHFVDACQSFDRRKKEDFKLGTSNIVSIANKFPTNEKVEIPSIDIAIGLVEEIESRNANLTDGVTSNWWKIACALADEFGDDGRALFHRIASLHPDYKHSENERHYDRAKSKANKGSFGSFIVECKNNGIELEKSWYREWYQNNKKEQVSTQQTKAVNNSDNTPKRENKPKEEKPNRKKTDNELLKELLDKKKPFDPQAPRKYTPAVLTVLDKGFERGVSRDKGLIVVSGLGKSMKTEVTKAIVASKYQRKPVLNFRLKTEGVTLYFDTEQSEQEYDFSMDALHKVAGLNIYSPLLKCFRISDFSVRERILFIDYYVKNTKNLTDIVIDGVKDICYNYNDLEQAENTVNLLKKWQEHGNIITVLHTAKSTGKLRGHLGTELENKASYVIGLTRMKELDEENPKRVFSQISAVTPRGFAPFSEFDFYRQDKSVFPRLANPIEDDFSDFGETEPTQTNDIGQQLNAMAIRTNDDDIPF